ncbi:MAG: cytochrome b N-terminal domain-containing protein [Bacteroidales bacterium]|nr:cytochrome b N-terminal domain-containing protein [Bacteroidales bacterium]
MGQNIKNWLKERIDLGGIVDAAFDEKIPGGASFFYTMGSATLFVFTLQVITGIWQLFYYVPTVDHAYASLSYFRIHVPYGWLIHGIHYWGANILAVLVALHIIRVFIWGAYKKPRELTWLIGVLLLFLVAGLIFTGAALPWDETGYWASEVGTSIAGTIPFIGGFMEKFLRGGYSMGQLTLSRFFTIHTVLIPALSFVIVVFHLLAFRKYGSVGPWKESKRKTIGDFWPDQVAIDLVVSGFIFVLIVWLSAFHPAPFSGPADPSDAAFSPKPEWNFLFLYQLLKVFKGPLEIVGTVGIPTLIVILLIAVPFLDRKESHSPLKRKGMMIGGIVFVGFVLTFTIIGFNSNPDGSDEASALKAHKGPVSYTLSPSAVKGETVFKTYGCVACHMISGSGGKIGPDLTNEYERSHSNEWLMLQLTDSKMHFPTSVMPNYTMLSKEQLNDLIAFLNTPHKPAPAVDSTKSAQALAMQKKSDDSVKMLEEAETKMKLGKLAAPGEAASIIGNVVVGRKLFTDNCASCHGLNGTGGDPNYGSRFGMVPGLNPISKALYSKSPKEFAENIDRFIQHGSIPSGTNPTLKMFGYGDSYSLTQPQIANIEAYILSLNHVNRAQIESPNSAKTFFYVTLYLYIGLIVLMIIFWQRAKRNKTEQEKL